MKAIKNVIKFVIKCVVGMPVVIFGMLYISIMLYRLGNER